MKKYLLLALILASCHKKTPDSHLISMQLIDRNGQTETISQAARIRLLEKQDYLKPQPYDKILRVYSKNGEGKNPSILTTYHKNGQLFQNLEALDGRAFGKYHEYYETGRLRIDAHVIEGTADLTPLAQSSWVFDGPCLIYYETGALEAEFCYDKGKRAREARYFYPDGALQKTIFFEEDLATGPIYEYFSDGTLSQKSHFIKGKQCGQALRYTPQKTVAYQEFWDQDELTSGDYFDPQGSLISSITQGTGLKTLYEEGRVVTTIEYKNGKPQGKIASFDKQGRLTRFYHIENDLKQGEEVLFYEGSDIVKMQIDWQEEAISGLVKTFYKDGTLESQKSYNLNKKNGPSTVYYPNGELMMLETYSQDRLVEGKYYKKGEKIPSSTVEDGTGTVLLFDDWGAVKKELNYEKGKIVLSED